MRRSSNALQQETLLDEELMHWKDQASARLQSHRARRAGDVATDGDAAHADAPRNSKHSRVADSVAQRYAAAPSYSEYLERAAAAMPPAKPRVRRKSEQIPFPQPEAVAVAVAPETSPIAVFEALPDVSADVRAYETPVTMPVLPLAVSIAIPPELPSATYLTAFATNAVPVSDPAQEEFVSHIPIEPQTAIPANVIEFPRLLVAARKARARLAEGPLRDPAAAPDAASQLRIFEVEPEQLAQQPMAALTPVAQPEWHGIRLDAQPAVAENSARAVRVTSLDLPLQVAPLSRRVMAASLDLALVAAGFCTFAATFVAISHVRPSVEMAAIICAAAFSVFYFGYQWLFCAWSDATPGMRFARIALCTFQDANPTRRQTHWRLLAFAMSAATLGLGLLWAMVDDDRLGWHDRISRTYQRAY